MSTPPPVYTKTVPSVTITRERSTTLDSISLRTPRTPRFAEATAVHSPIDPSQNSNPFADPPTNHYKAQPQIADVGFGYFGKGSHESVEMEEPEGRYLELPNPRGVGGGLKSPGLKSAMKSPGAAPRNLEAMLSPTFKEEQILEKTELDTDKEQAHDLRSKKRVRIAKFIMRGVNFSCSLIVLAMLSTTFTIFNTTRALPPRNSVPAWAPNTQTWPQKVLLSISCVSLFTCLIVFYGYWKGGHQRAEKVAVYYTTFVVAFYVFSIVMWGVGAAILSQSKANGGGNDIWGWSCKDNKRRDIFQSDVSYDLICRLQNWSLICCIIEVLVEVITIAIYGITFYRYYSKRRLRKSMAIRDRARSDLYLAQLKLQSAPNTPGLPPGALLSPRDGGWRPPQGFDTYNKERTMEEGDVQYATVSERKFAEPKPFALQPPPSKLQMPTAKSPKVAVSAVSTEIAPASSHTPAPVDIINDHVPAAPGEAQYGAVAIPGAYAPSSPLNSPGFAPQHSGSGQPFDFGLDSRVRR